MVTCDTLNSHPVGFADIGILRVVICIYYFVLASCTVMWLHKQSKIALRGDDVASRAVIFPVFVNIIWILAFSDVYFGILLVTIKFDPQDNNGAWPAFLYSLGLMLQHIVSEGIAILLMQKGCGVYAASKAAKLALIWGACAFVIVFVIYSDNELSPYAFVFWNACIVVIYSVLWLLPSNLLFRRPALYIYSKIFLGYRIFLFLCVAILEIWHADNSRCVFFIIYLICDPPIQFLGTYLALLEDSRWWQGLGGTVHSTNDSKSPLHGFDVSVMSAQELAKTLDHIGGSSSANLINFSHIFLDRKNLLGFGSFSKVYKGKYKLEPVAIKLIFTMDLTESDIHRVAAEATILSSINSKNIVKIHGVTVLPPSVCLVLELCAYGSLSDILRSNKALALSTQDRLFLALGCARGVDALHSLNKNVVHRDIKSFNFLVDDQLNAKLADLELGFDNIDDDISRQDNENLFGNDFLFNWLAPEVLHSAVYTQASDVYSLSLVLWEVMSGEFPFGESGQYGNSSRKSIVDQIISGRRPSFAGNAGPICSAAYESIVTSGWASDPSQRPTARTLVESLEFLWQRCGSVRLDVLQDSRRITSLLNSYFLGIQKSNSNISVMKSPDATTESEEKMMISKNIDSYSSCDDVDSSKGSTSLAELQHAIESDSIWKIVRTSPDPIMIISGCAPHIILSISAKFESLTGLSQREIFGQSFEDFVMSPQAVDVEGKNQKLLSDFYVALKINKSSHMVLTVRSPGELEDEGLPFSIHAMPVCSKDSIEGANFANGEHQPCRTLESLTMRDLSQYDFSVEHDDADKDILYYVLDMNYLQRLYENEEYDYMTPRTNSVSSIASKISGLFKSRRMSSTPIRHMSMQNQIRSSSFSNPNRNSEFQNVLRTSLSSGNLNELKDSFLIEERHSKV